MIEQEEKIQKGVMGGSSDHPEKNVNPSNLLKASRGQQDDQLQQSQIKLTDSQQQVQNKPANPHEFLAENGDIPQLEEMLQDRWEREGGVALVANSDENQDLFAKLSNYASLSYSMSYKGNVKTEIKIRIRLNFRFNDMFQQTLAKLLVDKEEDTLIQLVVAKKVFSQARQFLTICAEAAFYKRAHYIGILEGKIKDESNFINNISLKDIENEHAFIQKVKQKLYIYEHTNLK